MLLSATTEALARLRVSDLTAAAPCGPSLFEHTGFCKQGGPILDTRQARRVSGSWQNGSRPKAISEIARLRRSLAAPDPENRSAISIRTARPPIITVTGGWSAPTSDSRVDGREVFASVDVQITNLARPFHRMLDRNPQAGRRIGMVSEDAEHGGALCA